MKSCQVGAVPFTFIVVSLRAGGEDIVSQTYRIHFNIYFQYANVFKGFPDVVQRILLMVPSRNRRKQAYNFGPY